MKHLHILTFILLLAACTVESAPLNVTRMPSSTAVSPTPASVDSQLAGTAWELAAINGRPLIPGRRITLLFEEAGAGGYAGCNNYGGTFAAAAGIITISEIASTAMDCSSPEGVMEQEAAYLAALGQAAKFKLADEQLDLVTEADTTTLTFTAQEQFYMDPVDLLGTMWVLASWGDRELLPGTEITLSFETAEVISGFAGCRHYSGSYFAENDGIRFPSLSMVEIDCPGTQEMLIQEGDFTTALSQTTQYRLQEGQLELFTDPGERLLFVPLADQSNIP